MSMIGTLPKYVLVAGGPTLLIALDAGNPIVPRGTYIPVALEGGHVRLDGVNPHICHKRFTIHGDVWSVALQDHRIEPA